MFAYQIGSFGILLDFDNVEHVERLGSIGETWESIIWIIVFRPKYKCLYNSLIHRKDIEGMSCGWHNTKMVPSSYQNPKLTSWYWRAVRCFLITCFSFIFQKKAVSTAHCSQCNTIEFEMAVDWIAAEEKFENASKKLTEVLFCLGNGKINNIW